MAGVYFAVYIPDVEIIITHDFLPVFVGIFFDSVQSGERQLLNTLATAKNILQIFL